MTYEGLLFRRIVISSGYTYKKDMRVSAIHLRTKFSDDYEDTYKRIYRRNKHGYWDLDYDLVVDRKSRFYDAIRKLEADGYIKVSWEEHFTRRGHPYFQLCDDFIRLTNKGREIAPVYLKQKDPCPYGCSNELHFID